MQQQQQIQQQFLNQGQGGTFQPVNELLEGTEVKFVEFLFFVHLFDVLF